MEGPPGIEPGTFDLLRNLLFAYTKKTPEFKGRNDKDNSAVYSP
jgi:hypothetical protein